MANGKLITPSQAPASYGWVERKLDVLSREKVDYAVHKSELRRVEEKIRGVADDLVDVQARVMVLPAHECKKAEVIEEMQRQMKENGEAIKGTYKWQIRILATLLTLFLTLGASAVFFIGNLSAAVKNNTETLKGLKSQTHHPTPVLDKSTELPQKESYDELKDVIQKALVEALKEKSS